MFLDFVVLSSIFFSLESVKAEDLQFDSDTCGKLKGCLYFPKGCDPGSSCKIKASYVYDKPSGMMEMQLSGKISKDHFVAFGFSDDEKMGNDMVTTCFNNNGAVNASLAVNEPNVRKNNFINESGLFEVMKTGSADGFSHCHFRFPAKMPTDKFTALKRGNDVYYPLMSTGPFVNGRLAYHNSEKTIHKSTDFGVYQRKSSGEVEILESKAKVDVSETTTLYMAHGILMTFSWTVFISTGILFARHFREHWPETPIMGIKIWFHLHRTFNMIGIASMICGIVIIFIAKEWTWIGPSFSRTSEENGTWSSIHALLGATSCILAISQPLNAMLRCHPGADQRFIFNYIHRGLGFTALMLALMTIMIAAIHFESLNMTNIPLAVLVLFFIIFVLVLAGMEFLTVRRALENGPKKIAEVDDSYTGDSSSQQQQPSTAGNEEDRRTNLFLLNILIVHLSVAIIVAVIVAIHIIKSHS
ncbi:unnamed protein product [Caenorhabditis auriculariae]|uniref:Cytochrome b561 domain-containing protein n=1 Tax=Caenorhabditis auriculariae TaxID=2777116 RepID=A0A8S1HJT9_9PELO|nr:unnamed protein product [Caenorhabditis auriculariae]